MRWISHGTLVITAHDPAQLPVRIGDQHVTPSKTWMPWPSQGMTLGRKDQCGH